MVIYYFTKCSFLKIYFFKIVKLLSAQNWSYKKMFAMFCLDSLLIFKSSYDVYDFFGLVFLITLKIDLSDNKNVKLPW